MGYQRLFENPESCAAQRALTQTRVGITSKKKKVRKEAWKAVNLKCEQITLNHFEFKRQTLNFEDVTTVLFPYH
jgi:hypothetical protein